MKWTPLKIKLGKKILSSFAYIVEDIGSGKIRRYGNKKGLKKLGYKKKFV